MTTNNIVVPHAPEPAKLYWDSNTGLAVFNTDHGECIYDLQGLAFLITESRKRGLPSDNYNDAYQKLKAFGERFNS